MRIAFLGEPTSPNTQQWVQGLRQAGARVDLWPHTQRAVWSAWWLWKVRQWVQQLKPDLLIAYRTTSYGFAAATTGFRPLVLAAQGESDVWPKDRPSAPIKELCARYAIRRADLVHAWGEHMADELLRLGTPPEKLLILPRGIDVDLFCPPKTQDASPLTFITTRTLRPEYGHATIVRALGIAVQSGLDFLWHIAGDGDIREDLKRQVVTHGLNSQVRFHGSLPPQALARLMQKSHVYVSMPYTEGVSASLCEAMACGLYPIVSNLPANRPWIREGCGALIEVDDAEALAREIVRIGDRASERDEAAEKNRELILQRANSRDNMRTFMQRYDELLPKRVAA